jgi:hypothetical protein
MPIMSNVDDIPPFICTYSVLDTGWVDWFTNELDGTPILSGVWPHWDGMAGEFLFENSIALYVKEHRERQMGT